ncbi:hypothetical protein SAMN05216276_103431 [Streptosporangium subroseum]|uniref:Uncharacterized protein n=1 Tax=Streptosporangium subroseum TaxID=106412 RepID=A0A239LQH5_9ACTN|nr:hypothetical protein [Streptosporangium subroseum]SNT31929.1 hypothetical protein SAMN05216276_103431 [Streptosporangium subroseum]
MLRKRIATVLLAGALATAGSILVTSQAGAASLATYSCPSQVTAYGQTYGLSSTVTGMGKLGCYYGPSFYFCVYNAYNGDGIFNQPNPAYCPPRATQTG